METTILLPLRDNVLIKEVETEETSKGGIIIPKTVAEKERTHKIGKILAVGKGKRINNVWQIPEVSKGEIVVFNLYAGLEVIIDGEKLRMLQESDIIAKFAVVNVPSSLNKNEGAGAINEIKK